MTAVADRADANLAAAQASPDGTLPAVAGAPPAGSPVEPPSAPRLPELDLDTGRPAAAGEYKLADQTYAELLHDLVKGAAVAPISPPSRPGFAATLMGLGLAQKPIDPAIAADIEHFFAKVLPRTGPPPTRKEAREEVALAVKIKADLALLKTIEDAQ